MKYKTSNYSITFYLIIFLAISSLLSCFLLKSFYLFLFSIPTFLAAYFEYKFYKISRKFNAITGKSQDTDDSYLIVILNGSIIHADIFESKKNNKILEKILIDGGLVNQDEIMLIYDGISEKSNFSIIKHSEDILKEIKLRYIGQNIVITVSNNIEQRVIELFGALNIKGFISRRSDIIAHNLSQISLKNISDSIANTMDLDFFSVPSHNLISDNIDSNNNYTIGVVTLDQQNYENLWRFIQTSSISSAILDLDFNIILANRNFTKMLEVSDATNKNFFEFIDKEDEEAVKKLAFGRSEMKLSTYLELDMNNRSTAVHLHINYIFSHGRKYYVFTIIDTTKYKTMEMSFIHSQKMQAIGQLSGAIAHDFNNLLTAMIGFCDLLLQRHPVGDRSFSDLMQIKQNANRAANLVRQLLAFSRKQVLQPKVIDISSVLSDLANLIRRLIGENIQFDIHYGQDLDLVKVDQGQIEQVLINLVVNARDSMQSGGKLHITTSNILVDSNFDESEFYAPAGDEPILFDNYVLIEISDTGHGIPIGVLDKIFSPFFSTKSPGAGTGLGLSTVYGIITQTKGYVRLKTSSNGTSFFLFLKSYYPKEESELLEFKELSDEQEERLPDRNIADCGKILIVEDETPVRAFSTQALSNKGYTVLQADCPEIALKIVNAEKESIELIISDIMMPGMTGPKMIQEIYQRFPKVKVIFVSGYAEDALSDYDFPNAHFLAKPYSLKQLTAKVHELMVG